MLALAVLMLLAMVILCACTRCAKNKHSKLKKNTLS